MPRILREWLYSRSLMFHLGLALALGILVRGLCAYYVYGPQALDDYKHGVWPAYQHFAGLPLDIPAYRSHLLVWLLSAFVKVGSWFGADTALGQVRAMYFGLGFMSLLGVVGTYLFGLTLRSRLAAGLALYLVAVFPLFPFIGTRAFGEAVAMSLVALAFGVLEFARVRRSRSWAIWIGGFLILGVATLFRFHVGLLYLTYGLVLCGLRVWPGVFAGVLAGFVTLAMQAWIDVLSGKGPLQTLFIYMAENEGGGAKYGVSPWYNPVLFVLGVSLAPFSFVLWRQFKGMWSRLWPVLTPFLVFLLAHCVVAHKEERFLYPILILEFWAVAFLWAAASFRRWSRRVYSPVLLTLASLALFIVCFVNTQEGEIEPPAFIQSHYGKVMYLDHASLFGRSRFKFYFLRPPSELQAVEVSDFTATHVDSVLKDRGDLQAVALLTSEPGARDELRLLERVRTLEAQCKEMREAGSVVDRFLYKMNPKHNQRRRPTWYLVCERVANAS